MFNYYNTGFSLEITPKVQKVSQKYTFINKGCSKTRRIKNVKLSASQSRDKKSVRAYYDYEGNLQEAKKTTEGEFISASCIHSDKDIFIIIFFLRKKCKMFLRI